MRISDWSSDVCSSDLDFWARIAMIEKIGAIWYEAWIFDSEEPDAEPLFPVDFAALYHQSEGDDVYRLTRTMLAAAANLSEERSDLLGRRSEGRGVGQECVGMCRKVWWPKHKKTN